MKIPWPHPLEDVTEVIGVNTNRGKLAALRTLVKGRAKAVLDEARRGPAKMYPANSQKTMRRFKAVRLGQGANPSVFGATLQGLLDRALPGLNQESRRLLLCPQKTHGQQIRAGVPTHLQSTTCMLKKNQQFGWTGESGEAIEALRYSSRSSPNLPLPDSSPSAGRYILDSDTTDCAFGVVLSSEGVCGQMETASEKLKKFVLIDRKSVCPSFGAEMEISDDIDAAVVMLDKTEHRQKVPNMVFGPSMFLSDLASESSILFVSRL
ncbi:uncharacterized protein DEA37_0011340 [Paragonimus westermani]|uniref:Uncharacterized protein n=1 Tax=Paragonimus westermani TaxID=34504 RepID=A0A5J4NPZ5_9TREM|nr:uncharacterized protein DEA37_0011340 [Paragonimus westermani]